MRNITEWGIPTMAGFLTFWGYILKNNNFNVAAIGGISWGITFLMIGKIFKIIKNR